MLHRLSDVSLGAMPTKPAITEITVEHTGCYGPCPIYKVIVHQDGTATFIGQQYVERIGTYKASYVPFKRLAQAMQDRGFAGLHDDYSTGTTDQETVITTVLQGGRRKTVENYGDAGPQNLWEIQTLIDGAVAQAHWRKVSDSKAYPGQK